MTHYFDQHPEVASERATVGVLLDGLTFEIETDRGVFSHARIDTGTALLLQAANLPAESGDLLDLGCGSGVIAVAMALRSPGATVWAVDVNQRARQLTASNARRNGAENVRVAAPEDVPDDVRLATIWSNPPIRIGKQAMHAMLLDWLRRLTPDGTATLVVQKHLGADSLQRWLIEQGYDCRRTTSRAGYRLLELRPSGPA